MNRKHNDYPLFLFNDPPPFIPLPNLIREGDLGGGSKQTEMSEYSQTPLVKKLGLKEGMKLYVKNSPVKYISLLGNLPPGTQQQLRITKNLDYIHIFI